MSDDKGSELYTVVATVVDAGNQRDSRVMRQIPIIFLWALGPDEAIRKAVDVLRAKGRLLISASVYDHRNDDKDSYRSIVVYGKDCE